MLQKLKKYLGLHSNSEIRSQHNQYDHTEKKNQTSRFPSNDDHIISGSLVDYATNHVGDIDIMIINTDIGNIAIHFPPHVGKAVTQVVSRNKITVFSLLPSRKKWFNQYPLYNLSAIKNSSSILHIDDIKPTPPTGIPIEFKGFISEFKYNKDHFISGFIINGYLVDIPPHFGETITPLLDKNQEITIRGYKRNKNTDFINKSGYDIIRPYAFSINNTDYLL